MQKKKPFAMFLVVLLCVLTLAGCQGFAAHSDIKNSAAKYSIVCTTFPQYDWLRELIGERTDIFELTLLLDKGGDLHSYQPTAQSIAKIASADMFVYVGGESDAWVEEVLKGAAKQDMLVVNLMDALGDALREEESVEGMQDHHHDKDADETEYDEHIWLSLKNASVLTKALSEHIQQLDGTNSAYYAAREKAYLEALSALDREYASAIEGAAVKTLLFGDRFPFRYLTDDYGLDYYAAFTGCSTESDAGFETITFLSGKIDALNLSAIFVIEGSDQRIAKVIKQNTHDKNQQLLTLNSLQSVTAEEIANGFTYLKAMRSNLEVLKKAL